MRCVPNLLPEEKTLVVGFFFISMPPPPYSLFFLSCLLAFGLWFCFQSCTEPLAVGSLQTQEVNVFSSNHFEDLELVGFDLWLGCSKL